MDGSEARERRGEPDRGWTDQIETLLSDWRKRVYASQSAYYMEAERLRRGHYLLGIPVVIVSTAVGSALFASTGSGGPAVPNWTTGILSALAAVLASLQTFLRLGENAARHGAAADWYSAIRREIEQLQALPRHLRGDARTRLDDIRKEMNKAGQNAPELRESLWVTVAKRFGVEEPPPIGRRRSA